MMIEIIQLSKTYGSHQAVKNINLHIQRGELFGFIGPNGAGKTTTLKMMGGIMEPTSGQIFIGGINMAEYPAEVKQKIGFIPDRPYLYEKLTGMEFLKFIADLYQVDDKEFDRLAKEQLAIFSLTDWPNELIESYSHGMKQRLVLAAALIHNPEVIIVDEPTVGLDPMAVTLLKNLLRQLADQGVTIFMSTHSLNVAEDICDRIAVINQGELIRVGTVQELKQSAGTHNKDLEQVFLTLMMNQN